MSEGRGAGRGEKNLLLEYQLQPRPQGHLLDDFQNGGLSENQNLKIVEEMALGTRLTPAPLE